MGLGGDLIWTSVFRSLQAEREVPIRLAYSPQPTDLISGRFYDRSRSVSTHAIFRNNPRVTFTELSPKGRVAKLIDRTILKGLRISGLFPKYQAWLYRRAIGGTSKSGRITGFVDLPQHSYAARENANQLVWRTGPHIIDIVLKSFLPDAVPTDRRCELYWSEEEKDRAFALMKEVGLSVGAFIAFEPNTNPEYFGELRAWPTENWKEMISSVRGKHPAFLMVQVGAEGTTPFPGVMNIAGKLSFRETAFLLKQSRLFIGTEGGLIHAANAAECPTVAIWGGVTRPEFAGYPEYHRMVSTWVPCAGCGLKGSCPYEVRCMRNIKVEAVLAEVLDELKSPTVRR